MLKVTKGKVKKWKFKIAFAMKGWGLACYYGILNKKIV